MATANPFDLLGDDDNDDPSLLVQKIVSAPAKKAQTAPPAGKTAALPAKPSAKLPSKPLPPAQAVKEAKNEGSRGGRGGGRGYARGGRGGGGFNRDSATNDSSFGTRGFSGEQGGAVEESDGGKGYERRGGGYGAPRGGFRGGRRGGFTNGDSEDGDRQRRPYERRSGTGRGNEFKRDGAGRGNWGTQADEITQVTEEVAVEGEKTVDSEKPPVEEEEATNEKKENAANETEDKEPEDKEMTLEEYQKVLEEKRKALEALKTEERKVEVDKELAAMQQLSNKKKTNDDIFVKLGTDKDKRKELADKEEKAKKSLSINEFLKPASGEKYYSPGGGRSRGRGGPRGGSGGGGGRYNQSGGGGGSVSYAPEAPKIEDPSHFPTLGGK